VYRAWDPRLHREVALKLIRTPEGSRDRRSASIIREGRLLARVRHPGVVAIYDAEQIGTRVGLCMEFVEGPTLEQRLEEKGPFTAAETVEIGLQLCDALSAAHDAGVLHRDVKAANVVVKSDGRVVLMDFGAGRQLDEALTADLTGTPLYLAPEVLEGQEATVRSDLYSLGVLLHHILTGGYPVEAVSLPELRLAHTRRITGEPAGERAPRPGIPARLAATLERAIDPRPERRPASAASLAGELRALQARRARRGAVALAAALVAVTVSAGWLAAARGSDWVSIGTDGDVAAGSLEPVRIAIMPFVVAAGETSGDLLQEGMARDLIARLQTFDNARVISTASVFSVGALNLPLAETGSRLGVSAIVTGDVVRAGESVAVNVQLQRLPDSHPLWKRTYIRPASELLDLQRDVALDLARELQLQPAGGAQGWPSRSPDAYALYVRGRTALDRFTPDGTRLARQLFEQALRRGWPSRWTRCRPARSWPWPPPSVLPGGTRRRSSRRARPSISTPVTSRRISTSVTTTRVWGGSTRRSRRSSGWAVRAAISAMRTRRRDASPTREPWSRSSSSNLRRPVSAPGRLRRSTAASARSTAHSSGSTARTVFKLRGRRSRSRPYGTRFVPIPVSWRC
jgi:TolB-like protein/tRNA A-37 threonylcarbamoyl transferase component Bud32